MTSLKNAITGNVIVYQGADESISTNMLYKDETFWMTQKDMGRLFDVNVPAISKHLKNIFESGELDASAVISKMETTAEDGKIYQTNFYNLDAIIAVGYRVNSKKATQFRIWATGVLREYIVKGFALDDDMLKNGRSFGQDYFKELLRRVRSIRASERRVVDKFLNFNEYRILTHKGHISMTMAQKKAIGEYTVFNKTQHVISDFDKFVKEHS
ncbi:hypothetical protein VEHSUH05_04605 [Veillonella denticariosi JCM 15641]|uniref:Cell filamentation protein Fic n=1 Tax=Veillonella denticariosi JCM 15641 TaxID=1298594 RepID=A0A2S7ZAW3_9FIRM|nr:RhuM family protein [Veillonella denticariosi]PQL20349.1 hypothetical protein VEHSUH05_04605 [Veillonella denticariosi JCM 15641]